jgi:hypothetical protein
MPEIPGNGTRGSDDVKEARMAMFPIVVVKENPGTVETPGKLVVSVQTDQEHQVELKFPMVVGSLRQYAIVNGEKIPARDGTFVIELGEEETAG